MCNKKFKTHIFLKGMFANIVWPPKLANGRPCYIFLIQNIDGSNIFSYSLAKLANIPQAKNVGKHIPLKSRGLDCIDRDGTVDPDKEVRRKGGSP